MRPLQLLVGCSPVQHWFQIHHDSEKIKRHILSPNKLNLLSQSIMIAWDKTDVARVTTLTYHAMLKWDTQEAASSTFRAAFCWCSLVTFLPLRISCQHQLKNVKVFYMRLPKCKYINSMAFTDSAQDSYKLLFRIISSCPFLTCEEGQHKS